MIVVLLAIVATTFGAWQVAYRDIKVTYRLTAEVELAGQTYTGSGVVETRWRHNSLHWLDESGDWQPAVRGEAVVVDMGEEGALFITLTGEANQLPPFLPRAIYGWRSDRDKTFPDYLRRLANSPGVKQVPLEALPKVVTFSKPSNPYSADCKAAWMLQPGVEGPQPHIVQATLQMVQEPPTTGIEHFLPWLSLPSKELSRVLRSEYGSSSGVTHAYRCSLRANFFKEGDL